MSATVERNRVTVLPSDVGEIHTLPEQAFPAPIVRTNLRPQEQALSLPPVEDSIPSPTAPLTRFLGPALTVANPAWTGDPIPRMRALQKLLVEHSLTLAEDDRAECMAAISVVETAVRLRLRYQQMRMTLAEMDIKPETAKTNEKTPPAPRNDAA